MNILHLSDIHFGREQHASGQFENKDKILSDLLKSIEECPFKPEHIVVTGDIAWWGKKEEFDEAANWFEKLLRILNLTGKDITFCPGNHDVNRAYGNYHTDISPDELDEIDALYSYDVVHKMESPLANYEEFCKRLRVEPFHYPRKDQWEASYAIGYKDVQLLNGKILRFLSFNTALLSFVEEYPDYDMVIGREQVLELLRRGIIGEKDAKYYTIVLFHHAERFLHPHEICEYDQRKPTLPFLREYVDLILCGHTETGGLPVIYDQRGGAQTLTGGAAYYSDDHANAYSVILINEEWEKDRNREIAVAAYIYSEENGWHRNIKEKLRHPIKPIEEDLFPIGEIHGDMEFILYYDNQEMVIPIPVISFFWETKTVLRLNNYNDVTRNLDIEGYGPIDKPGKSKVNIKLSARKEDRVEAMLQFEKIFAFIYKANNAKEKSGFRIADKAGKIILSGEQISGYPEVDETAIMFLEKVRAIEKKLDVLFQCPDDNADERKVEILYDLVIKGYTIGFNAVPEISVKISDRKKLMALAGIEAFHKDIYIQCTDDFACELYGNEFSLKNISVYSGPYRVYNSKCFFKAITFQDSDERKVTLRKSDNATFHLVSDKDKYCSFKDNLMNRKYIEIGNMNLKLDFIYEKEKENES